MKAKAEILGKINALENDATTNNYPYDEQCLIMGKITMLKWVLQDSMQEEPQEISEKQLKHIIRLVQGSLAYTPENEFIKCIGLNSLEPIIERVYNEIKGSVTNYQITEE